MHELKPLSETPLKPNFQPSSALTCNKLLQQSSGLQGSHLLPIIYSYTQIHSIVSTSSTLSVHMIDIMMFYYSPCASSFHITSHSMYFASLDMTTQLPMHCPNTYPIWLWLFYPSFGSITSNPLALCWGKRSDVLDSGQIQAATSGCLVM